MKRAFGCVLIFLFSVASSVSQKVVLAPPEPQKSMTLHGRIVLYDWFTHEVSADDDFVVKTDDSKLPYVRIVYRPNWGFDAPASTAKDLLNRWAFVAHGPTWNFMVKKAKPDNQAGICSNSSLAYKYSDDTGEGEIPRFVPTPGANPTEIPPVQNLPCFILNYGGLTQVPSEGKNPTTEQKPSL